MARALLFKAAEPIQACQSRSYAVIATWDPVLIAAAAPGAFNSAIALLVPVAFFLPKKRQRSCTFCVQSPIMSNKGQFLQKPLKNKACIKSVIAPANPPAPDSGANSDLAFGDHKVSLKRFIVVQSARQRIFLEPILDLL